MISHQHLWQANFSERHWPLSNLSGFSVGLIRLIEAFLALTCALRFRACVLNSFGASPDQHTIEHGIVQPDSNP